MLPIIPQQPQSLQVLRLLYQSGHKGVSIKTFMIFWIPRYSARIDEIRKLGIPIYYVKGIYRMDSDTHNAIDYVLWFATSNTAKFIKTKVTYFEYITKCLQFIFSK